LRHLFSGILTRARTATLGVGVVAFGLIACHCGAAQAQNSADEQKLTIKSAAPSMTIAVPLAMMVNHTDRAHGITVDLQASGTSSTVIIDAVLAGQAEFGSPGTADALQAIRQGANLRIVAAIVNNLQVMVIRDDVMQRLGVSPTAPIADRVHALKGLIIGTGAVGSTHYQILRAYLKQYGVDPDRDVRLVGATETSAMISGIEQKRYDAIAYASPIVEQAIARHIASVWISGPRGDIPGSDNVKTCVIVARADTVEKHRADVDALRAALNDALRTVRKDHAAVGSALHDTYFMKLDPAVWELAWNAATESYPSSLAFTRAAYDYWTANDPKGADSYKNTDYAKVTYAPAQAE
jgi:NitT/TauT family transport system substrate-binding protein